MEYLFVGRQPIVDIKRNLNSFELLYRDGQTNAFPDVNPEIATIQVIVNTYLSPGFEQIATEKTFINFTEKLLMTDIFDALDPKRVVIEVLEDVKVSPFLLDRLKQLKKRGFQLALDDFILENEEEEFPTLFQLIDYIKVDFLFTSLADRCAIESLKSQFPHLTLLAEKIETEEQFEEAKNLGYELFQGYFFAKPDIVKSVKLPTDYLLYFELLKLLNDEEVSMNQITEVVMRDVSLSYKLLKRTNTYAYQSTEKINSIRQAILRMGLIEFKKWIQFLMIYQENTDEPDGRVKVLTNHSLVRANICELLAKKCGKQNTEDYYMLGMFSLIDLILKREPKDIFPLLPVSSTILETYHRQQTEMLPYLQIAEKLEGLDYEHAIEQASKIGIAEKELSELVLEAERKISN